MSSPPEPVIDLGPLDSPRAAGPRGVSRPPLRLRVGPRLRRARGELRELWYGQRSWLRPGLLALLVLGLVAGSTPRLPASATVELSQRAERFEVLRGVLVVEESTTTWSAYDLVSGERVWSLVRARSDDRLSPVAGGGLLLNPRAALAVLPASGEPRWPPAATADAVLQLHPDGEVALRVSDHRSRPDGVARGASLAHELALIDLATGAQRWRQRLGSGVMAAVGGTPPVPVTLTGEGVLSTHDLATGAVLTSVRAHSSDPGIRSFPPLVLPDQVLVWYERHDRTILRSYRADTLSPQWQRRRSGHAAKLQPCAPMLCLHRAPLDGEHVVLHPVSGRSQPATEVTVLDPATGQMGWVVEPGWRQLLPIGGRHLLYDARGVLLAVVDPATGEPLRDLRGWQAIDPQLSGARQVALVRTDVDRLPLDDTEQASAALLDLDTLELFELSWVPGRPERCLRFASGLACRYGQTIQIWNWPPLATSHR